MKEMGRIGLSLGRNIRDGGLCLRSAPTPIGNYGGMGSGRWRNDIRNGGTRLALGTNPTSPSLK